MMYYWGLDTSCYTTSLAVADEMGRIVWDKRKPLCVPKGALGLRQSEMVFQHIKNLPELLPEGFSNIAAVAASTRPRPVADSYMPVFQVADAFAQTIARSSGAVYYPLTHQHGHIGAALLEEEPQERLLALHVSGGTTDTLAVEMKDGVITCIKQLGSTGDIAAGQLIDRVGRELGLPFPAGASLEKLAAGEPLLIKSCVNGLTPSFSGAETRAKQLLLAGAPREAIALSVEKCVAKTLEKLIRRGREETGIFPVFLLGGVMANGYIRSFLENRLDGLSFAKREYATDNACGLARQAYERAKQEAASCL